MREKVPKAATREWRRLMNLLPHHPPVCALGEPPPPGEAQEAEEVQSQARQIARKSCNLPGLVLKLPFVLKSIWEFEIYG